MADKTRLAILRLLPHRADSLPISLHRYLPIPQQPRTKYGWSRILWSLAHQQFQTGPGTGSHLPPVSLVVPYER
jgi:hypothetical protein